MVVLVLGELDLPCSSLGNSFAFTTSIMMNSFHESLRDSRIQFTGLLLKRSTIKTPLRNAGRWRNDNFFFFTDYQYMEPLGKSMGQSHRHSWVWAVLRPRTCFFFLCLARLTTTPLCGATSVLLFLSKAVKFALMSVKFEISDSVSVRIQLEGGMFDMKQRCRAHRRVLFLQLSTSS